MPEMKSAAEAADMVLSLFDTTEAAEMEPAASPFPVKKLWPYTPEKADDEEVADSVPDDGEEGADDDEKSDDAEGDGSGEMVPAEDSDGEAWNISCIELSLTGEK